MTTRPPHRRRPRGFTIVELLTSVFIIAVIMVIVFPVIGALQNGSRIEAGLNTVGMSSDVARAWATASLPQADLNSDPAAPVFGASYSGTAAIFCPTGEVRIVINDQRASSGGNFLESFSPPLNGYRDYRLAFGGKRDVDYIAFPQGTGIAGVYRNNTGAHLIAPPFAIAYDRDGLMAPGANIGGGARVIYYDSNFDNNYDVGDVRSNVAGGYDPGDWDRDSAPLSAELVRELPFEAIETVAGVIIYDERDAESAGFDFSGGGDYAQGSAGYNWLIENGTAVFFSPNTGTAMRDEGTE
ncbi:prepilin-type N-terminal cleavage/methylation domain-containing protein [Phycisphaeraceae bacterium D3-23]